MPVVIDTPLPQQENHPITFADMGTKPTKTKRHMKDQPFISPQFQRHPRPLQDLPTA
ncbi:hypothetical protein D9611_015073 [Ephemerocybe angulata]|uniref:Uncharacterized protein n=1 Tax=Ephemerocybe angulata TaxID=980116 RepID=A0A8H5FE93_9AGAR|nr:hypothetical protein D9611_015073 [Tulosesus angulatus]